MYKESLKTHTREIEENTKRWEGISWMGKISTFLLKAFYRFNTISVKTATLFFTKIEKKKTQVYVKTQKPPDNQRNLKQ